MKKMSIIIIICVMAILSITSCSIRAKVLDDTEKTTKTINVADFDAISIGGGYSVVFEQDSVYSIVAEGTEAAMDEMNVEVADGVLYVSNDRNKGNVISFGKDCSCTFRIKAPMLKSVAISGSGDVSIDTLVTDDFGISISGSGDADIKSLEARKLDASISGSGDIRFRAKGVENTNLDIAGSGDMDTYFDDCGMVNIQIAGSGEVTLTGHVKHYKADVAGSGDVVNKGLKVDY